MNRLIEAYETFWHSRGLDISVGWTVHTTTERWNSRTCVAVWAVSHTDRLGTIEGNGASTEAAIEDAIHWCQPRNLIKKGA